MPTYEIAPERTALIVVDMQNDFVEEGALAAIDEGRTIAPRIRCLAQAARNAAIPVIYFGNVWKSDGSDIKGLPENWSVMIDADGRPRVCIEGTRGAEIYDEVAPQPGDLVMRKPRFSCFHGTPLADLLGERGIDTLIITGVAANGCCESTARAAADRDYRVIYVSDANATHSLQDVGWGPVSLEESMRVLLSVMAFAIGEVASTADLCNRMAAVSAVSTA